MRKGRLAKIETVKQALFPQSQERGQVPQGRPYRMTGCPASTG